MAAENSNKSKLKTYTSTKKNTFTLVTLQSLENGLLDATLTNLPNPFSNPFYQSSELALRISSHLKQNFPVDR